MSLDEKLATYESELKALQQQVASIDQQTIILQQRRQTLLLESKQVEGALEALRQLRAEIADQAKE